MKKWRSGIMVDGQISQLPDLKPTRQQVPDNMMVATPTCTANFTCASMQKHRSCRNYVAMFGPKCLPQHFELLMGVPENWSCSEEPQP